MKNLLKQNSMYSIIAMNSSTTNSYFRYRTDKRLVPPYLKPYKVPRNFRKQWGNVVSSFNEGVKSRQVAPLLHQIRSKQVLNAINGFNLDTLTNISTNVLVSFDYTYNITYKDYDATYTNTTNASFVSTTRDQNNSINEWVTDTTYNMISQSPIKDYNIIKIFNIVATPTSQNVMDIDNTMYDDEDEDLDDLLDLDLNGLDIDYDTLTNEETPQLPQELFNNDNIIPYKEQCETLQFDYNSKLPTTSSWDTKTGRCVYDFLIHYYSSDKSMVTRMTYHRLFKFFNTCDLPNIKHIQIKMWETLNGKDFNEEVKLFWKDIVRIQDKYKGLHQCDVTTLGKKKRNEYNKIFIKVCPLVKEVNDINIPNEMFLNETNLGLMSKQDFLTRDITKCRFKSYGEYYKDIWSVSIRKIREFCVSFKIPMYCLNQDDRTIAKYLPETTNKHKSLAFKVANGHFYGIEDTNAISFLGVINSKKTKLLVNNVSKKSDEPPPKVKIVMVKESEKTNTQFLYDTMRSQKVQVLNKNVTMKGNQILSFQLENTKYIFGNDSDTNYGKELMGDDWEGEHIVQCSTKIFKDLYPKQEHISSLNNQVLEFLSLEGVKYRTHLGATNNNEVENLEGIMEFLRENECDDMDIIEKSWVQGTTPKITPKKVTNSGYSLFDKWRQEKANKANKEEKVIEPHWKETIVGKDNYRCYDINKCYGAVLKDPLEPWIVCDFNSIFLPFDTIKHKAIPNGLYGIDTQDFTLFHGSNIYSKSMVLKGLKEGIITHDDINTICIAGKGCLPKNHFHKLITEFKTISKGNVGMYKNMINLMTGIMGKSLSTHTKLNISSSFTEFITFINDNKDQKPFCYVEGEGDNKIYMYGVVDERPLQENSLPIYIQILDESNIRLYDMIHKTGGKCLYRKTDCALVINPTNDLLLDEDWGGYSREKYPSLIHENKDENRTIQGDKMIHYMNKAIEKDWEKHDITDSSDYGKVQTLMEKQGGLMLLGRAGTGKSYVINNIAKSYTEQGKGVAKIAFTNVASLNICGTTIHKFLKLNEKGDLLMSRIKKIGETIDLIIIDEISMVSSFLWRRLYHLHDITKIPFLLVGDFRQIPPVEDMRYEDYRNHPTLIDLGKNSYCELEKIHRYDTALADLTKSLEGMNHIKKTDFKKKIGKVNICYLNKTRKKINGLLNNKLRPNDPSQFVMSPMKEWHDDETKSPQDNKVAHQEWLKDEPTQDIFVYEGMPMIARINKGDEISNNEKYVVKEIGETITLTSIRATEEGEPEEHEYKCSLEDLQNYMLCCYCMTTHKSQGVTIDGAVTIHDWQLMDKKLRYTAITRVKKLENVYMV
tara:strand:+ start:7493 stop:11491 length:3999 start_codon:yes stop_codon:yes gene_type:complete